MQKGEELTVNARDGEDLAGLASRAQPIAFDLEARKTEAPVSQGAQSRYAIGVLWWLKWQMSGEWEPTLRLRQLLQFIASRGSEAIRRAGSLSMPI
jgi:hypothetical protein